ncbi:hemerythrin domain-containing protein [Achromobacter spanius]|uniref:hemerythrin domain-containing protein n=1 Tax=Achromobacter spanius TaxID=217203 RepID=UPI00320A7012
MNCKIASPLFPPCDAGAPRFDIYVGIHKALRAMMLDALQAAGRIDVHDPAAAQAVCERVLALADLCASHLGHENDFVHPAMEARRPGSSGRIAGEHVEHLAAIAALRDAVSCLNAARGAARAAAALQLYRGLALFVGENFAHMHIEESQHNQVLWACYSDEELRALEGAIVASLPPAENLCVLRWMIPAMTPDERAGLLAGLQAAAPPAVVEAVLDAVRPHLSRREWDRLMQALAPARAASAVAA